MKIKHNLICYIVPAFFSFVFIVGGLTEWGDDSATFMVVTGIVIAVLCWVHRETNTLEVKDGFITGKEGFIKKRKLSSPLSKIQYCEFTTFLCFNKISVNAITGQYEFQNMKNAQEFVNMVNAADVQR